MDPDKKVLKFFFGVGIVLLQYILTQVVTLLVSLVLPGMDAASTSHPLPFALLVGACFSTGAFLAGWLALKLHWLAGGCSLLASLAGTLLGAYLPLAAALLIYGTPEAGNPFFFISAWGSVLGFHLPGWLRAR